MSLSDRIVQKARYYEVLAASYSERAPLEAPEGRLEYQSGAVAFTIVAVVLRELGSILDGESVD